MNFFDTIEVFLQMIVFKLIFFVAITIIVSWIVYQFIITRYFPSEAWKVIGGFISIFIAYLAFTLVFL